MLLRLCLALPYVRLEFSPQLKHFMLFTTISIIKVRICVSQHTQLIEFQRKLKGALWC